MEKAAAWRANPHSRSDPPRLAALAETASPFSAAPARVSCVWRRPKSGRVFFQKTRPVECSEHLGAVERFLGGAAKCSRASTGAEKHVGGSLHALQLKMANRGTTVLVGTSTVFRLQGITVPASLRDERLSADRKDQPQARPSGKLCRSEEHAAG